MLVVLFCVLSLETMPRFQRLDASGVLPHIIGCGIKGENIFRRDRGEENFDLAA